MLVYSLTRVVINHIFKALESEARGDVVPAVVQSVDTVVLYNHVLHWQRIQTWRYDTHHAIQLSITTPSCSVLQENNGIRSLQYFRRQEHQLLLIQSLKMLEQADVTQVHHMLSPPHLQNGKNATSWYRGWNPESGGILVGPEFLTTEFDRAFLFLLTHHS